MSAAVTPPASPAARQVLPGGTRPRRRWEVWRSPAGQPGWARPMLLAIAALAAALYAWNIASVGFAPYYSVAVKSMSQSWKAFFYGAFDPAATITIDKLPGAFVPQALSARVFGFHPWSLALPQVAEGVVTVLAMYRAVRQWAGEVPGLLAALLLTLTPILASVFGHPMEDGALTMCLVLAASAWQRAVATGRLRSLVLCGVWVGLGFQAKMLQAWMILPALFIGYLASGTTWPRLVTRLWQLAVAGAAMLAVSLSWISLFTVTPAASRPYVDGSTGNSAVAMVFGYNGLERFGFSFPGAVASGPGISAGSGGPGYGGPGDPFGLPDGVFKLLSGWYGPQAGWLYPLAVLGLVAGLYLTRWAPRGNPLRCGFLMWGTWLCTAGLVFSVMTTLPHTAYLAMLAPPAAALAAAGICALVHVYRAGRPSGWLLPAAVVAEVLWADLLWRDYRGFLPWALTAALAAGLVGAAVLVVARLAHAVPRRVADAALVLGVAAMLAAPAAWSASVLDMSYAGTSFDASAGPADGHGLFTLFQEPVLSGVFGSTQTLTPQTQAVYDYVSAHRHGAAYLLAVPSWTEASRFILATGQEAMPLGGFSGTVRTPTLARAQDLVRTGQLRFFWFGWFGGPGTGGADLKSGTVGQILSWVRGTCTQVPAAAYGNPPDDFDNVNGGPVLYECTLDSAHVPHRDLLAPRPARPGRAPGDCRAVGGAGRQSRQKTLPWRVQAWVNGRMSIAEPGDGAGTVVSGRNLVVRRGGQPVLNDLTFDLGGGSVTGLLGPSGCGKTTLMRVLVGVQEVTAGTVTVLGLPAGHPQLRARVGYATQAPAVYTDLTLDENLRYFGTVLGLRGNRLADAIAATVARLDLGGLERRLVGTFSGGQLARVGLAVALLGRPDLLILDEPTVGLDPVLRRDLWSLFHDLAADGTSLLVSSHVMDEAARCDNLLFMREGQFLAEAPPAEILQRTGAPDLESAFLALAAPAVQAVRR